MPQVFAPTALLALTLLAATATSPVPARAQDAKAATTAAPETDDERREREIRRECAAAVCSTLHKLTPSDGLVACSLQKTWRKEVLVRILSRGKITWPWGNARCTGVLRLDRAMLIKAMTEPEFEAQFDKHDVDCELDAEKEKYQVKLQLHPKVTFQKGKAVKASLNWGKIEGPTLAKTVLWPTTAADNSFGVLQSTVLEDVNEFIQTRCMEVKEAWQGK